VDAALRLNKEERPVSVRTWWGTGAAEQGPRIHRVGSGEGFDYRTISAAVARAAAGDRIVVAPGRYDESLVLEKHVEIQGDGKREEIIVSNRANCLLMRADSAVVRGLTLNGQAAIEGKEYVTIDIERGRLLLEDCIVTSDSLSCIAIRGEHTRPVIRGCLIHRGAEAGLLFLEGAQGTVEDCEIMEQAVAGVAVRDEAHPTLRRCTIRGGGGAGVLVYQTGKPIIEDCHIEETALAGVEIRTGGDPVLRNCDVSNGRQDGVLVHQQGGGTLERCTIRGNAFSGIECRTEGAVAVQSSRICDNGGFGVCVHTEGGGSFRDNEVSGNRRAAWFLDAVEVEQEGNREG
jgi:nitrous oxidase accessory protein NosD